MRTRHSESPRSDAGFTLIELLVTMALLALLSVALVSGIRYGTRIWQASDRAAGEEAEILSAQTVLQQIVERAYPEYTATTDTDAHVVFDGTADRFNLLTPDEHLPGGLSSVTVGASPITGGAALVAASIPELASDSVPATSKRVLLRNVASVVFSYYGKDPSTGASGWLASWQGRTWPPELVRVRVQFANAGARVWPDFIVAPRITADLKCSFDMLSKTCLGR